MRINLTEKELSTIYYALDILKSDYDNEGEEETVSEAEAVMKKLDEQQAKAKHAENRRKYLNKIDRDIKNRMKNFKEK